MYRSIELLERELDEVLNAHASSVPAPPRIDAFALMLDRERARTRGRRSVVVVGAAAASLLSVGAVAALGGSESSGDTVVVARAALVDATSSTLVSETTAAPTTAPTTTVPPTTIDTTPPSISITSPADATIVATKVIALAGQSEPGAKVRLGELNAEVGADGAFVFELTLAPGANLLAVQATDAAGNVAEAAITVTYNPPPPPTTKALPPPTAKPATTTTVKPPESAFAFTVNQKWYKCESNPPFEEFYGTAAPGSTITVASPHGGGSAVADAKGKWYLKVEFPTAPKNVYFEGTVSSAQGTKPFKFKYYVP